MTPMGEKRVHRHYSWFFHANLPQTDQWNLILYSLLGGLFRQKATRSRIAPIIAMGSGPVDSDPHLNSSTQAELFGLASALQFLQEFIKFHNIDTVSKLIIWSDSTAAIARLDYLSCTLHPGRPPANADIVSFLTHLLSDLCCRVHIKWVKSHQDNTSGQSKLSIAAALNVKADQLASEFLKQCKNTSTGGPRNTSEHFEWMQASLLVNGSRIHSSTGRAMREHIQETRYQIYFRAKHNLTEARCQNIDWKGFFAAFQSQPQKYRIIVTKYIHGWLPTGDRRKLIHNGDFSCPHCSLKETNEHLILCKHRKTEYTRNMYLTTTMRSKMNTSKVGKDISQIWLDYLSHIINTSGQPFRLCCAPLHYGKE